MKLSTGILFVLFLQFLQSNANPEVCGVVRIANSEGNNGCIGILITQQWVLTSAVCALKGDDEVRRIFFSNSDSFNVAGQIQNRYIHPGFYSQERINDIALIQLANLAPQAAKIFDIPRSVISREAQRAAVVRLVNLITTASTGYNETTETNPNYIYPDVRNVVILNNDLCSRYPVFLSENRLCSYSNVAIEGNEGAPLIIENQVIGLLSVSAVQIAVSNKEFSCGCDTLFPVTTYTSTANYRGWIQQITGSNLL